MTYRAIVTLPLLATFRLLGRTMAAAAAGSRRGRARPVSGWEETVESVAKIKPDPLVEMGMNFAQLQALYKVWGAKAATMDKLMDRYDLRHLLTMPPLPPNIISGV